MTRVEIENTILDYIEERIVGASPYLDIGSPHLPDETEAVDFQAIIYDSLGDESGRATIRVEIIGIVT